MKEFPRLELLQNQPYAHVKLYQLYSQLLNLLHQYNL